MAALEDIPKALYTRFATLSLTNADVSYPNGPTVIPVQGRTMYAVYAVISDGEPAAIASGAKNRYTGFLQVTILSPSEGKGESRALAEVQAVVDHFKRGTVCTKNGVSVVCRVPTFRTFDVGERYTVVVTVPWWADVPN